MSLILAALLTQINDITTSLDNPPAFEVATKSAKLSVEEMKYNPEFKAKQIKLYPDLTSLAWQGSRESAFAAALTLAQSQSGWTVVGTDPARGRIEAEARTALVGFVDDVVIEIRGNDTSASGAKAVEVHMRSRSRLGRSDLGANYKRIRAFLDELKLVQPGGSPR